MSSGPILALVLARDDAIAHWRELVGPTNTIKARQTHPDWLVFCIFVQLDFHFFWIFNMLCVAGTGSRSR